MMQPVDHHGLVEEEHKALKHARLTRLWTTVSLLGVTTVVEVEIIARVEVLNQHRFECFVVVAVLGGCFLLRRTLSVSDLPAVEKVLSFVRNPRYWTMVTIGGALLTQLILPFRSPAVQPPPPLVVRAKAPEPEPPPPPEPEPEPPPRPAEPAFPVLHVTGLVLNGRNSSAVINHRTVHIGETIEGATLIEVAPAYIRVEKDGCKKYFILK